MVPKINNPASLLKIIPPDQLLDLGPLLLQLLSLSNFDLHRRGEPRHDYSCVLLKVDGFLKIGHLFL